ncbi:Glucose-6-phosphate 1-dehydrogenase [hydrothermal vent metagenome]|uniref:Glucose-6-phosphate 1-dehydrogenase n=1 Tax=hydrothermal vent metagenome TaxID=652676 RepID=A0A3B0SZ88_9ZZZZ
MVLLFTPEAMVKSKLRNMQTNSKKAFLLFGATGDLAQRMLFPSLFFLEADQFLPEDIVIHGTSRAVLSDAEFRQTTRQNLVRFVGKHFDDAVWQRLANRIQYHPGDSTKTEVFTKLSQAVENADELMIYLSTSPSLYGDIVRNLSAVGLHQKNARIIVEKPIGQDLQTSQQINDVLAASFAEKDIFRIDHYLGKETVQNLLALRFGNILFEPLWNKASIESVQISISETGGVGDRWQYYDSFGAMRDMAQNHLIQLLCLVAMEPPISADPDAIRDEKVKVLRSLQPITADNVKTNSVRGQYAKGSMDGKAVAGYSEEKDSSESQTETFVALRAHIDNWRWAGVPFYLRTGKRMPKRETHIVVQFRDVPHSIFPGNDLIANKLVIELQPNEEISLSLMNKTPALLEGGGMQLSSLPLNLSLSENFKQHTPRRRIAYERLLLAAINNNPTLFVRRDEVEASWKWVDGIIDGWKETGISPAKYAAGTMGPTSIHELTGKNGHSWFEG